ncbi:hypothetical protein Hanom_Chr04g00340011 [Helianthus anomalus]
MWHGRLGGPTHAYLAFLYNHHKKDTDFNTGKQSCCTHKCPKKIIVYPPSKYSLIIVHL